MWLSKTTKIRLYASSSQFIRSERKLNKKKIYSNTEWNGTFIQSKFYLLYVFSQFIYLTIHFLELTNLNLQISCCKEEIYGRAKRVAA